MNSIMLKIYRYPVGRFLLRNRKRIYGLLWITVVISIASLACIKWIPGMQLTKQVTTADSDMTYVSYISQGADTISIGKNQGINQAFIPQYDYLKVINIGVDTFMCDVSSGALLVKIQDAYNEVLYTKSIPLSELPEYGWQEVAVDLSLKAGETYYLSLTAEGIVDEGPRITLHDINLSDVTEVEGQLMRNEGKSVKDSALQMKFSYDVPISGKAYVPYYILTIVAAVYLFTKIMVKCEF